MWFTFNSGALNLTIRRLQMSTNLQEKRSFEDFLSFKFNKQ